MRNLLFASAAIVALGVAAPGVVSTYVDPGSRSTGVDEGRDPAPAPSGQGRQVTIRAARDGHFYLDAEINFRSIRFVVDTGATTVALRESDASAAGIRIGKGEFNRPVATANGVAYAAAVMINSVTVEDIRVNAIRALVLPDEQLSISLLGSAFLNKLGRFEVADGTLIFEN